jgi:hypothetical protein
MHTRSGLNASPVRAESPSSTEDEDAQPSGQGRGRVRMAVRKVSNSRARGGLTLNVSNRNRKAGQSSSMKRSPKKKAPKQQQGFSPLIYFRFICDANSDANYAYHVTIMLI